jgi:hypothetical protein
MRLTRYPQFLETILHASNDFQQSLFEFFEHLARILIGASPHGACFALRLFQQSCAFCFDCLQQPLLVQHLLHPFLCLTDQALLFADNPARLTQLFRDRYPHPVDNVEYAIFVDQQPTAKRHPLAFGNHIFEFIDQLIQFDGPSPPAICAFQRFHDGTGNQPGHITAK